MNKVPFLLSLMACLAIGCATKTNPPPLTDDHPASPNASASMMPAPSDTFAHADSIAPSTNAAAAEHGAHHHGAMGGMDMHDMPQHDDPAASTAPSTQPSASAGYVCPMHPEVTSDKPGTCPKCGMNLVKIDPNNLPGGTHGGH